MVPVPTGSFCVVLGPYRNFPFSHRLLLELSMQSRVLSRTFVRSLVLAGAFCAVHSSYGNILCGPGSMWDLSMQSQVLVGTFHVLRGPYENFPCVLCLFGSLPCSPGSLWKHSVESQTLMRTFLAVLNPHRNFLCMSFVLTKTIHGVQGSYGNLSCGSRPFVELSVLSRVIKGKSCLFRGIVYVILRPFGTFVRSQKLLGNFLCGAVSLWDLSVRYRVLMGTFRAVPGAYRNFLQFRVLK